MSKIYKTKNAELVMASVGQLIIIVSGRKAYEDAMWGEYCGLCKQIATEVDYRGAFNYSPVVGPTAAQRKRFASELQSENLRFQRIALVSDSAIVRGAITATTWLTGAKEQQMKAFAPAATETAFNWLGEKIEFSKDEAQRTFRELLRVQGDDPMGLLAS